MSKFSKINLSGQGEAFRSQLETDIAAVPEDLRLKMGTFVSQYKKRNPTKSDSEILATFISMAYTLSPVPDLTEPIRDDKSARRFARRSGFFAARPRILPQCAVGRKN